MNQTDYSAPGVTELKISALLNIRRSQLNAFTGKNNGFGMMCPLS